MVFTGKVVTLSNPRSSNLVFRFIFVCLFFVILKVFMQLRYSFTWGKAILMINKPSVETKFLKISRKVLDFNMFHANIVLLLSGISEAHLWLFETCDRALLRKSVTVKPVNYFCKKKVTAKIFDEGIKCASVLSCNYYQKHSDSGTRIPLLTEHLRTTAS